jgi:glycosyltransferase involved in cell wall biosynthesis
LVSSLVRPAKSPSLLLLAYFFPPLGGPGAQRPAKLVKYLREQGWRVDVVSVSDIVFHSEDAELLKECQPNHLVRTGTLDANKILRVLGRKKTYFETAEKQKQLFRQLPPFDDKVGWIPFLYIAANKMMRRHRYDAIMVTVGPFSSGLPAIMLSKRHHVPLVTDFRDHWVMHPYAHFLTPLHRFLANWLEGSLIHESKAVLVASQPIADELSSRHGQPEKFTTVYNGWDDTDFPPDIPATSGHRLVYTGSFAGLRTPAAFLTALRNLDARSALPADLTVTFIGNFFTEVRALLEDPVLANRVRIEPQVKHRDAVRRMCEADALLLFEASYRGQGMLTGKMFEYLRAQRPILAMIPPDGDGARILRKHGHTHICPMESVSGIEASLLGLITELDHQPSVYPALPEYSRTYQEDRLMSFLLSRGVL